MAKIKAGTKADFKRYTKQEMEHDRAVYISGEMRDRIVAGHEMADMYYNIRRLQAIIDFRLKQLGRDNTGKTIGGVDVYENFEGAKKPVELLDIEYSHNVYTYKRQLMEFARVKEKMIKSYGFSNDDVKKIINGDFDWRKWQEDYEKENSVNQAVGDVK